MAVVEFINISNSSSFLKIDVANSSLECPAVVESWASFYIILSPVFLVGLVGNGVILFVFYRHKNVRSAPNTLLFSLALADFITLFFCATAPVYDFVGHVLPAVCPVIRITLETAMHGTAFTLVALSVERYHAIARPFRTKDVSTAFIRKALISIWMVSVTLSLLKFSLQTPGECHKCVRMIDTRNLRALFALPDFILTYISPLTVIAVFYALMARKLYFSDKSFRDQNITVTRQLQRRKRVALNVLLLVIIYAVSFFPYHFFSLKIFLLEDLGNAQKLASLIPILYCIGCVHISLNPFILYFLSTAFRTHFNDYLFCCVLKHANPLDPSRSNRQNRLSGKTLLTP